MILLCIVVLLTAGESALTFCDSSCLDSQTTCGTSLLASGCTSCALSLFTGSSPCTLLPQYAMVASDLNPTNMDLSQFTSSNLTPKVCGPYIISGAYIYNSYLQRTYTGLGLNHYNVVVRFSLAFIGVLWAGTEQYILTVFNGTTQLSQYVFTYACLTPQSLCNVGLSATDCFFNYEAVIPHSLDSITLKFTTSTLQSNPNVQFWGVKSLTVVKGVCASTCATCNGALPSNCLTCITGLYLLGSVCVRQCPQLTMSVTFVCVGGCPVGYYLNQMNSYCEQCVSGCTLCTNSYSCAEWGANPKNVFYDNLEVWIFLIVVVGSVFACVAARFWCAERNPQQNIVFDANKTQGQLGEENQNYLQKKKTKEDKIQGIGKLNDIRY